MALSTSLLATKLSIPPLRLNLLPRPRLYPLLEAGLCRPLTLISAPAGSGKTTLVSEWRASGRGGRVEVAWLSLDEEDNDPGRFLIYLAAALDCLAPGIAERGAGLLQSPQPPAPKAAVTALLEALRDVSGPATIALDDYHLIHSPPIHEAVTFLLEHLPANLHLTVITRADPPLGLARLRACDQVIEIRSAQLRFSPEEAALLLNDVMGLGVSMESVATLERRTEGWIVGLQLAALSMQGRNNVDEFVEAFAGSHRYIVDYLVDEVLASQPEATVAFLLRTSIADRLCASLCEALTLLADGQATLEGLEQANLFLIPLDHERRWFRYHHLFADVLRNRLSQTYPSAVAELHRRAAAWHEGQGLVADALRHALAANDQDHAARIVESQSMSMLMRGELATLLTWLRALGDLLHERAWLSIYYAWVLTLSGQFDLATAPLRDAERHLPEAAPETETEDMLGHIAAIRAYGAMYRGDAARSLELAQQALACLPENNGAVRSVATLTLGGAFRLSGDLQGAVRAFTQAVHTGRAAGNMYLAIGALSALADLYYDEGRLQQSQDTYSEVLQAATSSDGRPMPPAAMAFFGLSLIAYERNLLPEAVRLARECIGLSPQWGQVDMQTTGYIMLVRGLQAQGDLPGARGAFQDVERVSREHVLAPRTQGWVDAFRVRLWLAQGNSSAAERWASVAEASLRSELGYLREAEVLTLVRVHLAQGAWKDAVGLLEARVSTARTIGRFGPVIELLALRALALQGLGDLDGALGDLNQALALAQPEGYARVFLDEGPPMATLLKRAGSRGIAPAFVTKLLGEMRTLGPEARPPQPLIEPLTERELEILRLLADGKSNKDIAEELVLASGTVKRHLANVFGKLSVKNRTQCVARARDLNLL